MQQAIEAYLAGDGTLDDLQVRLVNHTLDMPEPPRLAVDAEFLIGEATSGNLTLPDLNAELRDALRAAREPGAHRGAA